MSLCTAGETAAHSSATPDSSLVARSECYLHKRDKTRPTIWRSIKVTDSAGPSPWRPGEFVSARQPALVIPDNVKCPSSLLRAPITDGRPLRAPPRPCRHYIYYTVLCCYIPPPLPHVRTSASTHPLHRRLFCSQPTAIEFFLRKTNPAAVSVCIHTPTHPHAQIDCICK